MIDRQTMTFIPTAQLKIHKSATSHEFSKQGVLLTFSGSIKLYCCWIGEAMMWPLFPAGSSIQQRSWHSSNRNSPKTKFYLHALHFSWLLHGWTQWEVAKNWPYASLSVDRQAETGTKCKHWLLQYRLFWHSMFNFGGGMSGVQFLTRVPIQLVFS